MPRGDRAASDDHSPFVFFTRLEVTALMIAFDLECANGHAFEGWFKDSASFEEQKARKLVSCPYCNDTRIRRIPSPVAVRSRARPANTPETGIDHHRLIRDVAGYIAASFEDVGADFTKEALKMHYGVKEKRSIRGAATQDEEETLKEEGIEYFKFPSLKKEKEDE